MVKSTFIEQSTYQVHEDGINESSDFQRKPQTEGEYKTDDPGITVLVLTELY